MRVYKYERGILPTGLNVTNLRRVDHGHLYHVEEILHTVSIQNAAKSMLLLLGTVELIEFVIIVNLSSKVI